MSDNTSIEWTDATWNPVRARYATTDEVGEVLKTGWHCERVSPGCQNCYAETINEKRFGTGLPYNRKSREQVEVYLDEKTLTQPLHWRRPRKIFVCSMTDLFGEWVPDEMIDRVFAVMALSPQHTYQVLTKRPDAMRGYLDDPDAVSNVEAAADAIAGEKGWCHSGDWSWPLQNVWLGTSAEDQERADQRIPELLDTPAAVRFISAEPLLGPLQLEEYLHDSDCWARFRDPPAGLCICNEPREEHISWVIVGGESGPGARPCDVEWIRDIVRQCHAAEVAVFVKQLGANVVDDVVAGTDFRLALRDRKGGDPAEWPEDLKVREFPGVGR